MFSEKRRKMLVYNRRNLPLPLVDIVFSKMQLPDYDSVNNKLKKDIKSLVTKNQLHYAVKYGNIKLTEYLIKLGADVNQKNSLGNTPLHEAANPEMCTITVGQYRKREIRSYCDVVETVQILIESGNIKINEKSLDELTPLHIACMSERPAIASILIQRSAMLDAIDKYHRRPLHYAVKNRNLDIVKLLVSSGAYCDCQDNKGQTPIFYVFSSPDIQKKDPDLETSSLDEILNQKITTEILKELINLNFSKCVQDKNGHTPLAYSIISPRLGKSDKELTDILSRMLITEQNINITDSLDRTPLHLSALHSNSDIMDTLLSKGACINAQDCFAMTALMCIPEGDVYLSNTKDCIRARDMSKLLMKKGADINIVDISGRSVLHIAVSLGHELIVHELLHHDNIEPNMADTAGITALHLACYDNDCNMIEMLLQHGASVNVLDNYASGPLHFASFWAQFEATELLLKHGADPFKVDSRGKTPLEVAQSRCFRGCINVLSKHMGKEQSILSSLQNLPNAECIPTVSIGDTSDVKAISKEVSLPHLQEKVSYRHYVEKFFVVTGVGHVHPGIQEVREIMNSVEQMVGKIALNIGKLDKRFDCKLIPSGSFYEGTKVGDPEEFDFMCELNYFSKIVEPVATDEEVVKIVRMKTVHNDFQEFVNHDKYLQSRLVMSKFASLLVKSSIISKEIVNSSCGKLYIDTGRTRNISDNVTEVIPGVSCELSFIWNGCFYKTLHISVDMVPALHFTIWPKTVRKPSVFKVMKQEDLDLGYHLVIWPDDQKNWRMSFSLLEKKKFNSISDEKLKHFILAKMIRHSCLCPNIYVDGKCDILANFEESDSSCPTSPSIGSESSTNSDMEITNSVNGCLKAPEKIISTYILKSIFLHKIEHNSTKDKDFDYFVNIYKKLGESLRQGFISSYFLPEYNLIGKILHKDMDFDSETPECRHRLEWPKELQITYHTICQYLNIEFNLGELT